MKKVLLLALVLLLLPSVALASTYSYSIDITLVDTGGTARTNLVVFPAISNLNLVNGGYLAVDALDSDVLRGGASVPNTPRVTALGIYVASLGSKASQTYQYQTRFSPTQTAFKFMAGAAGYVSTPDNASLEPGSSDFILEWKGYFDATKSGSLADKDNSFGLDSTTGTVRGFYKMAATPETLVPNGAGDETAGFTVVGGPAEWQAIDDAVGAPDEDTSYIANTGAGALTSSYALVNSALSGDDEIVSVQVTFRARETTDGTGNIQPGLRLSGTNSMGSGVVLSAAYADDTQTISRPGGGSWAISDLNGLQVRLGATTGGYAVRITQAYVTVNYYTVGAVTGVVATGAKTIRLTKTGSTAELLVGGVSQGTNAGASSVEDNGNVIVSGENGPAVYTEYVTLSVGGSQKLYYQPNDLIAGTTLPDRSTQGNTGAITWGSNPSNLTITISPLVVANAPSWVAGTPSADYQYLLTGPLTAGMFTPTPPAGAANIPFKAAMEAGADDTMGAGSWWMLFAAFLSMALGLMVFKVTQHPIFPIGTAMVIYLMMATAGLISWWAFILLGLAVSGFMVLDRSFA